jgi:FkbM family methyltransferase
MRSSPNLHRMKPVTTSSQRTASGSLAWGLRGSAVDIQDVCQQAADPAYFMSTECEASKEWNTRTEETEETEESTMGVKWARLLWHPHERLWNWDLFRAIERLVPFRPAYRAIQVGIIAADTAILFGRSVGRRVSQEGLAGIARRVTVPEEVCIYYFDLGTHSKADELLFMVRRLLPRFGDFKAFAFEADKSLIEQAQRRFAADEVAFINAAVCLVPPESRKIKLFLSPEEDGLGNSIMRPELGSFEEVPAVQFSSWLRSQELDVGKNICLLRMNIEGAEFDVIADLINTGYSHCIDGYFGMWDDLSKIDRARDDDFRAVLSKHEISPMTFNARDFLVGLRLHCIAYDVKTSILRGLRRVAKGLAPRPT